MENLTLELSKYPTISFKPGEILLQEGNKPSSVYILKEGSVLIMSEQSVVSTLDTPGTIIGEIAVLFDCKHTASVVAATDTTLYEIDNFLKFLQNDPKNVQKICHSMQLRLMNTGQKGLENRPLDLKLSGCDIETFSKNEVVIQEGQTGNKIYILRDGTVKAIAYESVIYRGNTPGMMFGEITKLIEDRYSISVMAVTDCSFYVIDDLLEFYKSNPAAALRISQFLAKRLTGIIDRFTEFKAEIMRNRSQIGGEGFLSKLVEFDDQINQDILNPFSKRK